MIRRVLLGFLVFGLVACGDDGTGDDGTGVEDIVGTYVLRSIDGEELPVTGTALIAGSLTLKQDMTCSLIQTATVEIGGREEQSLGVGLGNEVEDPVSILVHEVGSTPGRIGFPDLIPDFGFFIGVPCIKLDLKLLDI